MPFVSAQSAMAEGGATPNIRKDSHAFRVLASVRITAAVFAVVTRVAAISDGTALA